MDYGYTKELGVFLGASRTGRLLGIDPGSHQIGIGICDAGRKIASPHTIISRSKWTKDLNEIQRIVDENAISGIVIGYPLNMDGSEGPRCQSVRQMAKNLHEALKLPTLLWDERLSTSAVERMMVSEADLSRARRKELVDKLAASYLLQGTLDAIANCN